MMIHCNSYKKSFELNILLYFNNSRFWGEDLVPVNAFKPSPLLVTKAAVNSKAMVLLLLIVTSVVGVFLGVCFVVCYFMSIVHVVLQSS